jgi:hypothetical protein
MNTQFKKMFIIAVAAFSWVCASCFAGADTRTENARTVAAGNLEMTLQAGDGGIQVTSLVNLEDKAELLAQERAPLFELVVRNGKGEEVWVSSEKGWTRTAMNESEGGVVLEWENCPDAGLEAFRVTVKAVPNPAVHSWEWHLETEGTVGETRLEDVVFPQIALNEIASGGGVLYPDGPGVLIHDLWTQDLQKWQRYGGGWCSMQFMTAFAAPRENRPAPGFYYAMHDPMGSTKEIVMQSRAASRAVKFFFEHPIPNQVPPTNAYVLPGKAVWGLFQGDWYDAAQIYKAWVKSEAKWWPQLGEGGRADTPLWMRELCAWAQTGGAPQEVVAQVKAFAEFLELPVGFHWYNWHQIPFDNDYPHYFPVKEGFAEAVRELQDANVFVMPYINGRLWDTRDKGAEDGEFTSVAFPAVAKMEDGAPFVESYGSKESDGSPVKLGVMCPTTALWQNKVKEIVSRLQNEYGVKGVYIDQVAAATPVLCMDPAHGHPLAGGSWWNTGYWALLDVLRRDMAEDRMITTECNAEPFVNRFDGYLTWHWQTDGQVPAFPAVYGGAIQMFGRSYGGGDTRDLALRMKAAQQLVYGEQLGWLAPSIAMTPENGPFFKQMVQLRWLLRRYFYEGEMLRPPRLVGDIPRVKADWQWNGEHWVTTDAVLTGAWTLPHEGKSVLIFANVSDALLTATLDLHLEGDTTTITVLRDKTTPPENFTIENGMLSPLTLPARTAVAWEFSGPVRLR